MNKNVRHEADKMLKHSGIFVPAGDGATTLWIPQTQEHSLAFDSGTIFSAIRSRWVALRCRCGQPDFS
jgi:hypothetical protein